MRRKKILLMLPCVTVFDRIERLSFPTLLDATIDKDERNHMRGCIHRLGVCFRSRLRCQNKSKSDDEPGRFHVFLHANPVLAGSLGSDGRIG